MALNDANAPTSRWRSTAILVALREANIQLFLFVVFAWLLPPDRGEESAIVLMPFYGGFFGAITAAVASLFYSVALGGWIRRPGRSLTSRAAIGAGAAGTGALVFWLVFGYSLSGFYGLPVWGGIGAASAVLAVLVAAPLTVRASRRAVINTSPASAADPASQHLT